MVKNIYLLVIYCVDGRYLSVIDHYNIRDLLFLVSSNALSVGEHGGRRKPVAPGLPGSVPRFAGMNNYCYEIFQRMDNGRMNSKGNSQRRNSFAI